MADESAADFRRAIELQPKMFNALRSLGIYLYQRDRLDEATEYFRRALEVEPKAGLIHSGLAMAYIRMGKYQEGIRECRLAIEAQPDLLDPRANLGVALRDIGEYDQSLAAYEDALKLNRDCDTIRANRALIYLVRGQFEQGLPDYDDRWKIAEFSRYGRDYKAPRWEGADLNGKTIILWHEQGTGDTIHFARYARILADKGASVIMEVQKSLVGLLKSVEGVKLVITKQDALPPVDFHAPLMSLPGILKTTVQTIPSDVPYISADPGLLDGWRQRLLAAEAAGPRPTAGERSGIRVGIVWRGTPGHRLDRDRSVELRQFAPLAQAPAAEVRFVSLQVLDTQVPGSNLSIREREHPPFPMIDLTAGIRDFSDTAALIANLDLVISVDTAVVHLAGAMARPVWTLLPYVPDWRWLLDRQDTPWYPTMRLFRQPQYGNWSAVLERVGGELVAFARASRS
jgi:hypothetical protein